MHYLCIFRLTFSCTSDNLYFYLGGYRSILLPCTSYYLRDEAEDDNVRRVPPLAAHIDQAQIARLRDKKFFQPDPYGRTNRPGINLAEMKQRRLVSTEPLHEPYLVALLIALAEQQWWALGSATKEQATGVIVCELLDYQGYL